MAEATPGVATPPAAAPAPAAPDPNATAAPEIPKPEDKPEKTFTQKELDDILEKRLSKERRKREDLQRRLTVTEELALKGRGNGKEPPKPPADAEPKREDFADYESFIEARAAWRADKVVDARLKKEREEDERRKHETRAQEAERTFRDRARAIAKDIEDLEEVLESSDAPMTQAMAGAIMHSEIGPRLAYHLAKNPTEAERIAALDDDYSQAREMGKLEVKLDSEPAPKKKPPSDAPEPIEPVGGRGKVASDEPSDKDSSEEWLKKRNAQLRRKKG